MPGLHVPAWKRLGLQLKNAAAPSEELTSSPVAAVPSSKKRKLSSSFEVDDDVTQSQIDAEASPSSLSRGKHSIKSINASPHQPISGQAASDGSPESDSRLDFKTNNTASLVSNISTPRPLKKRKSVQFSADVRAVDGPEEPLDYSATDETTSQEASESQAEPTPPAQQKVKKQKKEKKKIESPKSTTTPSTDPSEPTSETSPDQSKPYLDYLTCYHDSRSTWKFNKNLQTQILQNTFNLYRIPSTYDPALSSYIRGLQGLAARTRLRESAHKLLDDLDAEAKNPDAAADETANDATEDQERRRAAYEASPEYQMELKERARAEAVLKALAESADIVPAVSTQPVKIAGAGAQMPKKIVFRDDDAVGEQKPAVQQQQQQQTRKKSRGRKRRTIVDDDDSSSSSSSSDDSSDSE